MSKSEQIDIILGEINHGDFVVISSGTSDLYYKALQTMKAYGLIIPNGGKHDLTQKGIEAYNAGGFDRWLMATEQRASEIHTATLDSANATVDAAISAKQSKYAAIISILVTIVLFIVSYIRDSDSDSKINALERKVDTLSAQLRDQSQSLKAKGESLQMKKMK